MLRVLAGAILGGMVGRAQQGPAITINAHPMESKRMPPASLQVWQDAERLLQARNQEAAGAAYSSLLQDPDWRLPACLRLSSLALEAGRLREAVELVLRASQSQGSEQDAALLEALCRQLIELGELRAALACARSSAITGARDPTVLAGVGQLLSDQSFPDQALPLLHSARELGGDSADLRYQIGLCRMYSGDLAAAAAELDGCLRLDADFAPAQRIRSKLRRQTPDDNHVTALRAAVARTPGGAGSPLLHYALFKELDDLGDTQAAWQSLQAGMHMRRAEVAFDEAAGEALFDFLMQPLTDVSADEPADQSHGPVPIFIVGMPRSGTTLLERILGSHPQVADAGELRDFNFQLRYVCDQVGGPHLDLELARRARGADLAEVGRRYLSHTQWYANGRDFYTDKLPANFIHVGHIAQALPRARILHMVREPMDTCFSNLKELFADAYPHSYDQGEMARHFLRYQALMTHWHARFPGRILDVHYDRLVAQPEAVARQALTHCGLDWDPSVLAIEARSGAVATASSVQMREPIHARFVGQWRRYEAQLQPMIEALGKASR